MLTRNFVSCHSENAASLGGITPPMSLTSYEVTRRWASRIATAVRNNYMPPWDADVQHQGVFKDEPAFSVAMALEAFARSALARGTGEGTEGG